MMIKRMKWNLVLGLGWVILISCGGIDNDDRVIAADKVWDNFRQFTISEKRRVETAAARALVFTNDDKTVLTGARLGQYGANGEIEFRAMADEVEARGNGDGFARGNVVIEDLVENVIMEADYLNWNSDDRLLTSDGKVTVDWGDGLTVSGDGFEADVARRSYKFAVNVRGTLVVKDDEGEENEKVEEVEIDDSEGE